MRRGRVDGEICRVLCARLLECMFFVCVLYLPITARVCVYLFYTPIRRVKRCLLVCWFYFLIVNNLYIILTAVYSPPIWNTV